MNYKIYFLLTKIFLLTSIIGSAQTEQEFYGTNVYFHNWNETNHTIDGYDWSMPNWVKPAENSGLVSSRKISNLSFKRKDVIYSERGFKGQFKRKVSWNWRKLEPQEGVYDFQSLRDEIKNVSENGKYKLEVNIYAAVFKFEFLNPDGSVDTSLNDFQRRSIDAEQSAPQWLVDTYNIPRKAPAIEGTVRITNLDEFDSRYHFRYKKLITALGESGILNDPIILNAYVCLGSPTRGEEGEGPKPNEANYDKYIERLDVWAEAAGSNTKKLTSVSSDENNAQAAIDRGMGQRGGFVEQYLMRLVNPQIGSRVNAQGYLEFNENAVIYKENRTSGDENENYFLNALAASRFGEPRSYKHRYRESTLRALQMRRTTIWDEWAEGFVNPPLSQFLALSLAKRVNTTADAWCYLRQSDMILNNPNNKGIKDAIAVENRNPDGTLPVKNFERWLYQRDGGDIKTIPVRERGQGGDILFRDKNKPFDYTARRTDASNGFNKIGFALDDRFIKGKGEVAIKVSYEDNGTTQWFLQYTNTNGGIVKERVTNQNTRTLKTITWVLKNISFNATGMNNDFFLIAEQGDLTASFVRVIKLDSSTDGGNGSTDGASNIDGPDVVLPGKSYTVDIDYTASEDRSVILELKQNKAPFTNYGSKQVNVSKGTGTVSIPIDIDPNIPLGNNEYKWFGYIFPKGGGFSNNLGVIQELNIDCLADDDVTTSTWRIENKATKQWISPLCRLEYNESVPLIVSPTTNTGTCTMFNFIPADDGYYFIENVYTKGRYRPKGCSDIVDDSIEIVQVGNDSFGWCVQWKLIETSNGYFRIQNRQTGHWIRSEGCSGNEGTRIKQVSIAYTGDCTAWKLIDVGVRNRGSEISNNEDVKINFYPNPVNNNLILQLGNSLKEIQSIKIYDLQGRVAKAISKNELKESIIYSIDVSGITNGMYILSIDFNKKETQNSQFIIKH
ncbi:T9SS C-terminal target domain-containing protein [Aquimarina sp. AD1]|uniref:T9SS type A sorting domain-containing protein n=1 Tax=Aquimarina sp. (strain AD1) TaxID=1714848 RepID=UPI000E4C3DA1|nr:T9SS type A sorting domain-containing protein [Aquimarina sp. AD1]AXT58097.1 T9SS C-terminal target domain-containing protein [Aquimarina sp. AD1]RKN37251.1 T9SS C-terminal target domain-containing protein [Aquimarina sp. AD1]